MFKVGLILFCFVTSVGFSQMTDQNNHAQQALKWSLIPGAGQVYNQANASKLLDQKHHSWWKLPVIYGGIGACGYFAAQNFYQARLRKLEWRQRINPSINAENPYKNQFLNVEIVTLQSEYRDYSLKRNVMIAGIAGIYLISIAEAYLSGLNIQKKISDNSQLSVAPTVIGANNPGFKLNWSF